MALVFDLVFDRVLGSKEIAPSTSGSGSDPVLWTDEGLGV